MRLHLFSAGFLVLASSAPSAAQSPPPASMPGLRLSIDELKAQYAHLGAGKRLKPKTWPNGARVAVALSFDVDNATVPLSRGLLGSEDLSRGMYGAIDGLPRILRVLLAREQNVLPIERHCWVSACGKVRDERMVSVFIADKNCRSRTEAVGSVHPGQRFIVSADGV